MRALLLVVGATVLLAQTEGQTEGVWRATAPLSEGRSEACAVRLADGRVLVSGGRGEALSALVEIYQTLPEERFRSVAPMRQARAGHACTLLEDGRVLVAGGAADAEAGVEVYDPSLDAWTEVRGVALRAGSTATTLRSGLVLLAGAPSRRLHFFDPGTMELRPIEAELAFERRGHTATLLGDGRVLLAGGLNGETPSTSFEIVDGETLTIVGGGELLVARTAHTATALQDGRVLFAGGRGVDGDLDSLEVYRPESGAAELLAARLATKRQAHIAVLVEDGGQVLLAGGSSDGEALGSSESFDPLTDQVVQRGSLTAPRTGMAAALLEDGRAMAIGGRNANGPNPNCGVLTLSSIQLRFTQSVYRPGEVVAISGTVNTLQALTATLSWRKIRLSDGALISLDSRLLTKTVTITGGIFPLTRLMQVDQTDPGHTLLLSVFLSNKDSASFRTAARFPYSFSLTVPPGIVQNQAIPIVVKGPAFALPNFGGTYTMSDGARSVTVTPRSDGSIETNLCCPSTPSTLNVTARYSGNNFYEASNAPPATLAVVSNIPLISELIPLDSGGPLFRVLQPTRKVVTVQSSLRGISPQPSGMLARLSGSSTSPVAVEEKPVSGGTFVSFDIVPSLLERRNGICVGYRYGGNNIYQATTFQPQCSAVGPAIPTLRAQTASTSYTLGVPLTFDATLTWPNELGIVGRAVNVVTSRQANLGSIPLTPDPTGLGNARGSAFILIPFESTGIIRLAFSYPASGDLDQTGVSQSLVMNPVPTVMNSSLRINVVTNPFTLAYTLEIQNRGMPIPSGTPVGGLVEVLDGTTLLASQSLSALNTLNGAVDGVSNTIGFAEAASTISVTGQVRGLVRPVGLRTITIRYTGSPLFAPSSTQVVLNVQ